MSKKIVTLGEIMLRLSPPGVKKFVQADSFDINYGGGEANVAVALCQYGMQGVFISKVPDNAIGQSALNHLRRYGVDTQFVVRGGERLGIYFLETGVSLRPSGVIYDRKGAAITEASVEEFDFDKIFEGADWFHTSGITPALGDKAAALTEAALKAAKARGINTSIDLNYRKKLWTREKAGAVMSKLCRYADICIGVDDLLLEPNEHPAISGSASPDEHRELFRKLRDRFGFKYMTSTLRKSYNASDNRYAALVYDGTDFYHTKEYEIRIVDRVGTGDSFAAGFIYGLVSGMELQQAAEFGTAAGALKHTIPGDSNHATLMEIEDLLSGDATALIKR